MIDDETAARFDGIDRQLADARRRFDSLDQRLDAVDQRFDAVDRRFDAADDRFGRLEAFIREESAATRHHFDVVSDGLRAEIRLIAEGHAVLAGNVASLAARQDATEARLGSLEDGQRGHERRLKRLERK